MQSTKLFVLPVAFVGGLVLSFSGCTEKDPNHCLHNGGDEFCGAGAYCTNNCGGDYQANGCLVAEQPPSADCWACMGEGSENCDGMAEDTGSETATETATDTTMGETATETTAESSTTEGPECMDSSMCGGETPLCEDGACVACGEGVMTNCASEYPDTPACDATGACVECTSEDAAACGGMTPVCEGNVCVACDEHDECPESACNMSTGACMDPARVWWVDQGAADGGDGSEAMPFNAFAEALALIGDGEEGTIYLATVGPHTEQLVVFSGRTVAAIGKSPGWVQFSGAPALDVNQGATVFIGELAVAGGNDLGMRCNGCDAWISRSRIVDSDDGCLSVQGSANVHVSNAFIGGNLLGFPAVSVSGGELTVVYSTLAGGSNSSPALSCLAGTVDVRNSLVVAVQAEPEVDCGSATLTNNAMEMMQAGNTQIGEVFNLNWFADFSGGDFSLSGPAPTPVTIATAATWQTGDPATDIDGDARPTVDGTPDYAGADIPN